MASSTVRYVALIFALPPSRDAPVRAVGSGGPDWTGSSLPCQLAGFTEGLIGFIPALYRHPFEAVTKLLQPVVLAACKAAF